MELTCPICGRVYIYDRKKGHKKNKCNSCYVNERRDMIKKKAIEYKGSKCIICGYDACQDALDFHHLESEEKEFKISGSHSRSWASIQKELDKCVLVCCRCHRELHAGLTILP